MTDRALLPRPTALLGVATLLVAVYAVLGPGPARQGLYTAVVALAALAAWVGARGGGSAVAAARLVAAGLGLHAAGDATWIVVRLGGTDPSSVVTLADVLYLSGYGVLGTVLLTLLLPGRTGRHRAWFDTTLDVLTMTTVSVVLMWELVVRDRGPDVGGLVLLYPVLDGVLLALAVRALVDPRTRTTVGVLCGAGLLAWLLADWAFLVSTPGEAVATGTGVLWMSGSLLLALACPRIGALRPPAEHGHTPSDAARLSLSVLPLLVPPGLLVIEAALGRRPDPVALVVAMLVLILLTFVRTEQLLVQERRAREDLGRAHEAALAAARARTAFLVEVSRDIRTPMNQVLGLSRLLGQTRLDEEQHEHARGIETAGRSLRSLLDDVLELATADAGQVQVERVEHVDLDVVEVVEAVAAMVHDQAERAGLELVAHTVADVPRALCGDPTRLHQVLLTLTAEAVRSTPTGEVVLRAVPDPAGARPDDPPGGTRVRFEIADTDPDTHRGLPGAVEPLVHAMAGECGRDHHGGRGGTSWCSLPLAAPLGGVPIDTRPGRAVPGTRVLVVDDNASHLEAAGEQLRTWGLQVDLADGAQLGLRMVTEAQSRGTPYALVLVDQVMPSLDGAWLARAVRRDPAIAATPMLLMTSGPSLAPECRRAIGIEVTVAKPVQRALVQAAVHRALGGADPGRTDPLGRRAPLDRGVVLVVEDSEVNRLVAVGTLRQLGYLTEVAVNGREAVDLVVGRNYDAVLMDCRMPVLDGYDATAEIRRREAPGVRTPIIAVAAGASEEDRARCLRVGMDDYVSKPLGRPVLAEVLARWVPGLEDTQVS